MSLHVLFRAGGEGFALPLPEVREVTLAPATYARVPRAPDAVRGVMTLRGRVLTAVCLSRLLGLSHEAAGASARILVLDGPGRDVGLVVEDVAGIRELSCTAAPEGASPAVVATARLGEEPVRVLGVAAVLALVAARLPD